MSKVAMYLQEHILGEVSIQPNLLNAMSRDESVLEITPEMVVFPRVTNDIRKVCRFSWQLAEKGHVLAITPRGNGSDQTGGAIGEGIILATPAHMNNIFELDSKQKLVRVQPGVVASALNAALRLNGASILSLPTSVGYSTVGGAVANNASGPLSGLYGSISEWIHELEVVLANGDVLQTSRISKRELSKKKGLQTFEGEIYRSLDNLIEDNLQLIDEKLGGEPRDNVGYASLSKVKKKDGSFDLTPLFAGSQGTLGIISEMILKTDFSSMKMGVVVASFATKEAARDALDSIQRLDPSLLEYIDGEYFKLASEASRNYEFIPSSIAAGGAVVVAGFDDFSDRIRAKKMKKMKKYLDKLEVQSTSANTDEADDLLRVTEVTTHVAMPNGKGKSAPPLFDGVYIPPERFEDFSRGVAELASRHHVSLPLHGRVIDSIYYARPTLQLQKVSDKQKIFKLLDEYTDVVDQCGGHLIGEAAEGRVKARFAYKQLDDETLALFKAVKAIFDPYGILNPGVKQASELKYLVAHLRTDDSAPSSPSYTRYS